MSGRFQCQALAHNLGNFLRTLATLEPIKDWTLTTLKEKLIKIGAKVVAVSPSMVRSRWRKRPFHETCFAGILQMIAEHRAPPLTSTAQSVRAA